MATKTAAKGKPGRKRKLREPKTSGDLLCELLAYGLSRREACNVVGVSLDTLAREEQADAGYAARLRAAESQCISSLVKSVFEAATKRKQWQPALAMLARKRPNEWAQRRPDEISPQQLTGILSQFVAVLLTTVPSDHHGAIQSGIGNLLNSINPERSGQGVMSGQQTKAAAEEKGPGGTAGASAD